MFDQMKAAFKKAKSKDAPVTADASGGVVKREPSVESKPAVVIDLGDALLPAGANAALPAPTVIDCGTWEPAPPAPLVTKSLPDPAIAKVTKFITACPACTMKEVAGGAAVTITDAQHVLNELVSSGVITHSGEPEHEANRRKYTMANYVPPTPEPKPEPYISPEQRMSNEAQRKHREELAAQQPPPAKRYEPTPEEIQAALDAEEARRKAIKFTPEEREELRRMEGRVPVNPQSRILR